MGISQHDINRQRFWKDCALAALEQCKQLDPRTATTVSANIADQMLKEFDKRFSYGSDSRR